MPKLDIKREYKYIKTFRSEKVAGMFDLEIGETIEKTWEVNLPCEELDWNIGLVVGPSGCGKTTIGKKIFGSSTYHDGFTWDCDGSFLNCFDDSYSINEIIGTLCSVGFSSPPHWLLPFSTLSNGQKFRVELARLLLNKDALIVFDEFTSVVDRDVAKFTSSAIAKVIRKNNTKFVALTCHYDISDWLEPDWVYEVVTNSFKRVRLRRPEIRITIRQCDKSAWQLFKGYHYLNTNLHQAAQCFIAFIENKPVGFCAVLHMPHPREHRFKRGHRTVVLPDYQGMGIGNILSDSIAQYYINKGYRFISTTSHPSMIHHRVKSERWKLTRKPSYLSKVGKRSSIKIQSSYERLSCSFEYMGKPKHDYDRR